MLKQYEDTDFPILENWIADADLLLQFSGTDFSYPIKQKQIFDYRLLYPDRKFYIGYTPENIPFAFGEIIPQDNGIPRLARVLVGDPGLRGRGLGKYFIQLLVDECKLKFSISSVELLVWDKNPAAISCYQAIGFVYSPEKEKTLIVNDLSFDIHRMTYTFSK
ncbi:MAG TPA: GNAT family N-acetyltransferase [Pedobacter sp.]|jgi:RimJ/RimL family protein N-acetyltransferase